MPMKVFTLGIHLPAAINFSGRTCLTFIGKMKKHDLDDHKLMENVFFQEYDH
jgi:hypothetical protein